MDGQIDEQIQQKQKLTRLSGSAGVLCRSERQLVFLTRSDWKRISQNFLLMHAMGPNVAGVIGSAIAAGVMLKYVGTLM